jgi:hypothetical protein
VGGSQESGGVRDTEEVRDARNGSRAGLFERDGVYPPFPSSPHSRSVRDARNGFRKGLFKRGRAPLTFPHLAGASGGLRRVTIPPQLGFGPDGAVLRPTEHVPDKQGVIPGGATLDLLLELKRVSIPPT